jgi:hypothetical protein
MFNLEQTQMMTPLYKLTANGGLPMLTPQIVELCKQASQASVEQDIDRFLCFVSEINRLFAVRDEERHNRFAFICNPEPLEGNRNMSAGNLD